MPSRELAEISQQIEDQGTDHFSKFYMYAGLLNVIAVRAPNTNIDHVQPKTLPWWFGDSKRLKTGLEGEFVVKVNQYQNLFHKPAPDAFTVIKKMVMAYARKGQLADLAFIIDKMLAHLSTNPLRPRDSHNRNIYNEANFDIKKVAILDFINSVSTMNHQMLSSLDKGANAVMFGVVALAGFIVMITSIFSLAGFLVGAAMLAGGVCGQYNYGMQAMGLVAQIENSMKNVKTAMETLNTKMSKAVQFESEVAIHRNFITDAIIKPVAFSAITIMEQISIKEKDAEQVKQDRESMEGRFLIR